MCCRVLEQHNFKLNHGSLKVREFSPESLNILPYWSSNPLQCTEGEWHSHRWQHLRTPWLISYACSASLEEHMHEELLAISLEFLLWSTLSTTNFFSSTKMKTAPIKCFEGLSNKELRSFFTNCFWFRCQNVTTSSANKLHLNILPYCIKSCDFNNILPFFPCAAMDLQ